MATRAPRRLPAVKPLSQILPKGTEGGKEFARIVDLLLFHEARRAGKKMTIFNDAAGDYMGLDSFEGDSFRRSGTTGYQYKFYPGPLAKDHRAAIEKSLVATATALKERKVKLTKWILVVPDDLTESATRKDGGDLSWFESLRGKHKLTFQVEYWGHKKLLDLFLQNEPLCLFYYPELIDRGATRRKTIQDTRRRYDDNLIESYGKIEFVGMSVYKEEATRGVPMENIYIPLTAIAESADETNSDQPRTNPVELLARGSRHVVLGDPGSGKSTLLRFLGLVGISEPLRERCGSSPDDRLAVLVILRRYADDLKESRNLSLIDHIIETVQADFSLKSADLEFFEYALETGQAILLFDGLDELPNPQFKKLVADRIRGLATTYPGNTTIVTSRIVGYEAPFRFDDKQFRHLKLARLRLPEIERFIHDWYAVRIENKRERKASVDDLVAIVRDDNHGAIRQLAENPLLLTIVALVHRIDAVLPDERVVLYQKCTETLLNTWQKWKYRESEERHKGKEERRNRSRIEAIAHWMHCRAGDVREGQRAMAPFEELLDFLTRHIESKERWSDAEVEAIDLAAEFLEFVKRRAGLMIEVGDRQYSFVHLTFQEYLTATHIVTTSEHEGVKAIWESIQDHCADPRWREVIRLLVAHLKSPKSQEALVDRLMKKKQKKNRTSLTLLLSGMLLDGIESAEARQGEIVARLLRSGIAADTIDELRSVTAALRAWLGRSEGNCIVFDSTYRSVLDDLDEAHHQLAMALLVCSLGIVASDALASANLISRDLPREYQLFKMFVGDDTDELDSTIIQENLDLMWMVEDYMSTSSFIGHLIAAANQAVVARCGLERTFTRFFRQQLASMPGLLDAYQFHTLNCFHLVIEHDLVYDTNFHGIVNRAQTLALDRARALAFTLDRALVLDRGSARHLALVLVRDRARDRARVLARDRVRALDQALDGVRKLDTTRTLDQARALIRDLETQRYLWPHITSLPEFVDGLVKIYSVSFNLEPAMNWAEIITRNFLVRIPKLMARFYDPRCWERIEHSLLEGKIHSENVSAAAWLLLIDTWLWLHAGFDDPGESPFRSLAESTRDVDKAPLRVAHCIRDLAYGDESRSEDLVAMVRSDDPAYREIFEACNWR